MANPPNLGYGSPSEASIDQVNIWMRGQPWYQNQMRQWGQDPGHPTINGWQSDTIKRLAQANGVVVDEGNIELDDHGNFNPIGHKLRNTLLVAGAAAAAIFAQPALAALAGGGGSSAAAGSLAAVGPSTAANLAATAAIVSGSTVPASLAAGGFGAASAGTYAGMLAQHGLPAIGSVVNGVLQYRAAGSAQEAAQRYLEEALAYQKEQDAYARATDAARYGDTRKDLATALAKDETRYAGYQGRIAPFIATGTSANARMAQLLGLRGVA